MLARSVSPTGLPTTSQTHPAGPLRMQCPSCMQCPPVFGPTVCASLRYRYCSGEGARIWCLALIILGFEVCGWSLLACLPCLMHSLVFPPWVGPLRLGRGPPSVLLETSSMPCSSHTSRSRLTTHQLDRAPACPQPTKQSSPPLPLLLCCPPRSKPHGPPTARPTSRQPSAHPATLSS